MWRRWKAGESLHEIGRAFGKDHGSIQFLLSQRGGIVPVVRNLEAARIASDKLTHGTCEGGRRMRESCCRS
jgi:hypothetical protein